MPMVGAPFPYVAAHVAQAQFVRFLFSNRLRFASGISGMPGYPVRIIITGIFVPFRQNTAARGELPFGFAWQAVFFSGLSAQPFTVSLGVVPRYVDDRSAAPAPRADALKSAGG